MKEGTPEPNPLAEFLQKRSQTAVDFLRGEGWDGRSTEFILKMGRFFEPAADLWRFASPLPLKIELLGMPYSLKTTIFNLLARHFPDDITAFPSLVRSADYMTANTAYAYELLRGLPYDESMQNYKDASDAYYVFEHFRVIKGYPPVNPRPSMTLHPKLRELSHFFHLFDGFLSYESQRGQMIEGLGFDKMTLPLARRKLALELLSRGRKNLHYDEREIVDEFGSVIYVKIATVLSMFEIEYPELSSYDQIELYRLCKHLLEEEEIEFWLLDAHQRVQPPDDMNFAFSNHIWLVRALGLRYQAFLDSCEAGTNSSICLCDEDLLSATWYLRAQCAAGRIPHYEGIENMVSLLDYFFYTQFFAQEGIACNAVILFMQPPDISLTRSKNRRGHIMQEQFLEALWRQHILMHGEIVTCPLLPFALGIVDASGTVEETKRQIAEQLNNIFELAGKDLRIDRIL